jgi:hypothetical protein
MSISEFSRWLDIAASDGIITAEEESALLDRANALSIDDSSARLLIEQRRQLAASEPPKCPKCKHRLSEADVTLVCPNCQSDIGSVKLKGSESGGIIDLLNKAENAVTALSSVHIPKVVKSKSPLHAEFANLLAKADSAVSQLERHYGVNPMVVEMSQTYRTKLASIENCYKAASKRGGRSVYLILATAAVVLSAVLGLIVYRSNTNESRAKLLNTEFNRLIAQEKFDSAMVVYQIMRDENIPEAYHDELFVKDGDTTRIPELQTVIMNGKALAWLNPIIDDLQKFSEGGPYDSCYVLLKRLDAEWRSFPTTNSEDGLHGDANTMRMIEDVREATENRMFDYELQNGKLDVALKILSKVSDSPRRKAMLEHALEYLKETNRPNDAAQVSALLGE